MGVYQSEDITRVIKGTTFWTDRKEYVFLKFDRGEYKNLVSTLAGFGDGYVEIILDRKELTVIIPKSVWTQLSLTSKPTDQVLDIAIITCDAQEPTVTGYLLEILKYLSPKNIGVYVQGAYTTDHIFVDYHDLDKTLLLLEAMKKEL